MTVLSWIVWGLIVLIAAVAAGHALVNKRDPRSALGWIAVCLFFPVAGPLLYIVFGVNRIQTLARKLHEERATAEPVKALPGTAETPAVPAEFAELARISDAVSRRPMVRGKLELLHNGEEVFPAMLEAIRGAKKSLYLSTYIFETNRTGQEFIGALGEAAAYGVDVRVLLDGVGDFYSMPRASKLLRRHGVSVARFLPPTLIPPRIHVNLRNHRKMLTVDGEVGFTGGMNIGDRHLAARTSNRGRVVDTHFRVSGPIVSQIENVFLEDWAFVTGERSPASAPPADLDDGVMCRTIVDGPNEDLDHLTAVLLGAVSAARRRVAIMTPYFLPPLDLVGALQAAALRGVEVSVILPARNNLPFVHWASRNGLWELLHRGVRIYYQPPPFAHTKLFVVDDHYALIGSANLDPRSLRLNFELAVEVYDTPFATELLHHFETVRATSREVSIREIEERPFHIRFRDSFAWLFSPYL